MLIKNEDEYYQAYLTSLYEATRGYQAYSVEAREALLKDNICITYGELLYPSVKKIIRKLQPQKTDVFLDLGSGLGKCAVQVFMQSDMQKVMAIEAASALHQQALAVKATVQKDFPDFWQDNRALDFYCDNFLTHDWDGATLVYSCSTCFTRELLDAIGEKINAQKQVQQVLSLRPLPTLTRLRLQQVFSVECSWDSALCFHYSLKNEF